MDKQNKPHSAREMTRFLGFRFSGNKKSLESIDDALDDAQPPDCEAPLGRLVIVDGPGRGETVAIKSDYARIGRAENQEIQLAFGDSSISRDSHAIIYFYGESGGFLIRDGRKANPVLLNDRTVTGEGKLKNRDMLRIGETTLRFLMPGG